MRSENIRAYISRSFTNPMWHDILGNKHMQKAIIMAQVCLYVAAQMFGSGACGEPKECELNHRRVTICLETVLLGL